MKDTEKATMGVIEERWGNYDAIKGEHERISGSKWGTVMQTRKSQLIPISGSH